MLSTLPSGGWFSGGNVVQWSQRRRGHLEFHGNYQKGQCTGLPVERVQFRKLLPSRGPSSELAAKETKMESVELRDREEPEDRKPNLPLDLSGA